ncbi:conserved hypothetical protein [Ricinus communis]|uniref:Uncharacterized protein n=1 Tax=Ricinus communis TaxID=3988 RepID=B9RHH8_RICCO|nr:conserved hypothetical protein [Ricinus communis]
MNKLWNELVCLMPIPICTCGAAKGVADITSFNRLMQFLMGLNDSSDNMRNQVLEMDPFPSANIAYSMVFRVEKQREVPTIFPKTDEIVAMMIRAQNFKTTGKGGAGRGSWSGRNGSNRDGQEPRKNNYKRYNGQEEEAMHCDFCGMD